MCVCMRSGVVVRSIADFVLRFLRRVWGAFIFCLGALVLLAGNAAARDIDFSCTQGTFSSGSLCRNGSGPNNCSLPLSNNATDTVDITDAPAGTQIAFTFTRSSHSQDNSFFVSVDGQNSTNGQFSPDPTNVTFSTGTPTNTFNYTVTSGDAAASPANQANFQIQLETGGSQRRALTYSISCTLPPPPKGQLKIVKSAPGGGPGDTFDFEIKNGAAVVDTVSDLGNGDD